MDEREANRPTGTMDAHGSVLAKVRGPPRGPSIDGPGPRDSADLGPLLQAIAARLDVLLDEKGVADSESEGQQRAARAWSTVVGKRPTDVTSDLRRRALATTVLRISADGRVDLDDRQLRIADDESQTPAEGQQGPDRQADAHSGATAVDVAEPAGAVLIHVRDVGHDAPTDRSGVEDRLREARRRLAARRGDATTSSANRPRASRVRRPAGRKIGSRSLVGWLLIGLAIVTVSALVSILVT